MMVADIHRRSCGGVICDICGKCRKCTGCKCPEGLHPPCSMCGHAQQVGDSFQGYSAWNGADAGITLCEWCRAMVTGRPPGDWPQATVHDCKSMRDVTRVTEEITNWYIANGRDLTSGSREATFIVHVETPTFGQKDEAAQ